jgi:starch-binding outer membrane protein, SusD/RagB family
MNAYINVILRKGLMWVAPVLLLVPVGCKKAVNVGVPSTSLTGPAVFQDSASAVAAAAGVFQQMLGANDFFGPANGGDVDFTSIAGLSADEFTLAVTGNAEEGEAYMNAMTSQSVPFWSKMYNLIYLANAVIEGVQGSTGGLSDNMKQNLMGQMLFVRAFAHFYLVNIFGAVPLVTTASYTANNTIARSQPAQVYAQIVADLQQATTLVGTGFTNSAGVVTPNRTLPNQGAAQALLARVYLYTQKYDSALLESNLVISNTTNYALCSNLNNVFLMNSTETIWSIQPAQTGYNTPDGFAYILTSGPNGSPSPLVMAPQILSAFEAGDNRSTQWVGSYQTYSFPYKYKQKGGQAASAVTEYYVMLRLAEQYLIRAEAEANGAGGGITSAVADMNVIRNRAGLANYSGATDQASVLSAILHERQVELFCEMGHRWLDLIRTGNINSVLGSPGNVCQLKGGTWAATSELFPIPASDILIDPNLTQNPGYN